MSTKAVRSKRVEPPVWELIHDHEKGIVGFYRVGIPYCIFSKSEWAWLIANPKIIPKKVPYVKPEDDVETDDNPYTAGHA